MTKKIWEGHVLNEWVDFNGHMNDAAYAIAFSQALDALMIEIGIDESFRTTYHYTIFTLETHLVYLAEAHENEELSIEIYVLDRDAKRMHLMFTMRNKSGNEIATSEQMTMGMDQDKERPAHFPAEIAANITNLPSISRDNWPKHAGRSIGIRRK